MKNWIIFYSLLRLFLLGCTKHYNDVNPSDGDSSKWEKVESNTDKSLTDIFFINDTVGIACGVSGTFLKTSDAGKTWATINVGINHSFLSVFATDENTFFTARTGLYKTEVAGNNFKEIGGLSSNGASIFDIIFFSQMEGLIIKGHEILKTSDGGNNWHTAYSPGLIDKMQFASENIGYAYGGFTNHVISRGEIHKTEDGGNNWRKLNIETSEITVTHFIDDKVGFFFNLDNQLYKTTDGGESWRLLASPVISPDDGNFIDLLFINESTGFAIGYSGVVFRTVDAGKNWQVEYRSTQGMHLSAITRSPDKTIYVVGDHGIILKRKKKFETL